MRVAVIGANGQLGTEVVRAFAEDGCDVYALTHTDIEIACVDSPSTKLRDIRPQVVVNTAAMHDVDKCEQAPAAVFAVNALGARNLTLVAREICAVLVQISTDYVFDGTKQIPYAEGDSPRPLNVYGNTKLA